MPRMTFHFLTGWLYLIHSLVVVARGGYAHGKASVIPPRAQGRRIRVGAACCYGREMGPARLNWRQFPASPGACREQCWGRSVRRERQGGDRALQTKEAVVAGMRATSNARSVEAGWNMARPGVGSRGARSRARLDWTLDLRSMIDASWPLFFDLSSVTQLAQGTRLSDPTPSVYHGSATRLPLSSPGKPRGSAGSSHSRASHPHALSPPPRHQARAASQPGTRRAWRGRPGPGGQARRARPTPPRARPAPSASSPGCVGSPRGGSPGQRGARGGPGGSGGCRAESGRSGCRRSCALSAPCWRSRSTRWRLFLLHEGGASGRAGPARSEVEALGSGGGEEERRGGEHWSRDGCIWE